MDRRQFLTTSAVGAASILLPYSADFRRTLAAGLSEHEPRIFAGWIDSPAARRRFLEQTPKPLFSQWDHDIRGTGDGKQVLLIKAYESVTGKPFDPRFQTIGDCVGEGSGLATDILTAVQVVVGSDEWKGDCASEVIYAGSRVQIAGRPGRSDGSNGVDAAEWLNKFGVVLRGKYGEIDLTKYRPDLERQWTAKGGVPDELCVLAKGHPVHTIARCDNFDQLADGIANGYPCIICSNQGFNNKRDQDGFLRATGVWSHCMCVAGIDTLSARQGGLIINSWGSDWVSGPTGEVGCPLGSFWADKPVINRMLAQHDSYLISNLVGYPRRTDEIDYHLY